LYGLIGFVVPTAVLLVAYPILVHYLGAVQTGIYFLATSFSSIAVYLDLGVSSAATKFVAEDIAKRDEKAASEVIVASSTFYSVLGAFSALLVWLLSPWLVSVFSVEQALRNDAVQAFRLAAIQFAIFLLIMNTVSIFKGMQRFDHSTLVVSSLSALPYGAAVLGLIVADVGLVGVAVLSLLANLIVLVVSTLQGLLLCRSYGIRLSSARPSLSALQRMLGFGVAFSVHLLTVLFNTHGLRLLVGALIGPAAVTIYVLASTAASMAHRVIDAASQVLFPLSSAGTDRTHLRRVYLRMLIGALVFAILVLLPLAVLAEPLIAVWVGADLAHKAAPLIQIFAVGYFFIALSPAPFYVVNGIGRPWFNVAFDLLGVAITALALVLFALDGITLVQFAWAFTIANVAKGLMFQTSVEILIWRRDLLPELFVSEATKD
jgi:O-antigen/teichoic acid export membrane protein